MDEDRSELSFNLKANLDKQIATNEKNVTLLREQASLNKEIAGYSNSFNIIAAAVERIGGKGSIIAGPFRNMAEASRETARDLVLQNKAIADKKALLENSPAPAKSTFSIDNNFSKIFFKTYCEL